MYKLLINRYKKIISLFYNSFNQNISKINTFKMYKLFAFFKNSSYICHIEVVYVFHNNFNKKLNNQKPTYYRNSHLRIELSSICL